MSDFDLFHREFPPTGSGEVYAVSVLVQSEESVCELARQIQTVYDESPRGPAGIFSIDLTPVGKAITFIREADADFEVIKEPISRRHAAQQLAREFEPVEGDPQVVTDLYSRLLEQQNIEPGAGSGEGWELASTGGCPVVIRREPTSPFATDEEAVEFVRQMAVSGSVRHLEAFAIHRCFKR